jgi:hypothetical protein
MAFTTPKTWSLGNTLTAADLNTYVRDNIAWLATDRPFCRVRRTALQATVSGTNFFVTFDAEDWDNQAMHSTVTNTGRITIPAGGNGKYVIAGGFAYSASATGRRDIFIRKNGTTYVGRDMRTAVSGIVTEFSLHVYDAAVAGDYYEIGGVQDSGVALNVDVASALAQPWFMARWLAT